jgi:hypothetical protein
MEFKPHHRMLARGIIGLIMVALAFFGLILTDIQKTGAFGYWEWISPVYAVLGLWLSWYEKRNKEATRPITIFHELLHWGGLIGAVALVSMYVRIGILGRFEAGLFVLTILSLSVYLAGILIDPAFYGIGIILGMIGILIAFFNEYLYAISIPILVAGALWITWLLRFRKKEPPPPPSDIPPPPTFD